MDSETKNIEETTNPTKDNENTEHIPQDSIDKSIKFLKKFVKESNIPGQNHLDVTLVDAQERDEFYSSMAIIKSAEKTGQLSSNSIKETLGLI